MRRIHRRVRPDTTKQFKVNQRIVAPEVFLIDFEGNSRGVMTIAEAQALAAADGLDLVEVNPTATPPMVKILDFGQFKYERDKQLQKQKSKQKKTDTKCVRLSMRIGAHDLAVRLDQAQRFLSKGHKLKVELLLKGREKQHFDIARETLMGFFESVKTLPDMEIAVEEALTRQGGKLTMLLANKKA